MKHLLRVLSASSPSQALTILIMLFIMFNNQGVQQELQGAHQGPHEDSRNGVRGKAIFLRPVWGEVIRLEKSFEISVTLMEKSYQLMMHHLLCIVDANAIARMGQGKN